MLNINGKEWRDLTGEDVSSFLALPETEESFFFEFKDDRVESKKLAEEISALANTYGGYIFLGVSDDKSILGCSAWNEQRIFTTIHDSVTPTPSFDVKKLICNGKTVYVIKINEGSEPPYITSQGKIYERVSSGTIVVRDSVRLMQMYTKNEEQLRKTEKAISIPPIVVGFPGISNVYGYIDIGFQLTLSDRQVALNLYDDIDLKEIAKNGIAKLPNYNLARVGTSIFYSPGGLSSTKKVMPAHINNFIEIMCDGSARMRVLLHNNNPNDTKVNMIVAYSFIKYFREIYGLIFKDLFPNSFIFAKKYEALTVLRQFQPYYLYEDDMINGDSFVIKQNELFKQHLRDSQELLGVNTVITDNRIPKSGLYTVDRQFMQKVGIKEYTKESIIGELFYSQFVLTSYPYGAKVEEEPNMQEEQSTTNLSE